MKTPTNFIPIIGPLYADDLQPAKDNQHRKSFTTQS